MNKTFFYSFLTGMALACQANGSNFIQDVELTLDAGNIVDFNIEAEAGQLDLTGELERVEITTNATIIIDNLDENLIEDFLAENIELTLELVDGKAVLKSKIDQIFNGQFVNAKIDLNIAMPDRLNLNLADGAGDIDITGVTGTVSLSDGSGTITAREIDNDLTVNDGSGDVDLSDVNGDITVNDGSGNLLIADSVTDVTTITDGSGDVEIINVSGDVTIVDGSGDIIIDGLDGELDIPAAGSGDVIVDGEAQEEDRKLEITFPEGFPFN